jgi:hypothetical protein
MLLRVLVLTASALALHAQYAKPPQRYSLTEMNSMFMPGAVLEITRDGTRAVVDQTYSTNHVRTYYDLQSGKSYSLDLKNAAAGCSPGTFTGDWGDPFTMSADLNGQLVKAGAKPSATETVNGAASRVFEAGPSKAWVETKYGLIVKMMIGGQPVLEVRKMSLAKPPAAALVLPASCTAAAAPPTTAPGNPDFIKATMPPASANSCTAHLRVVRGDSMEPIASGFRVVVDKTARPLQNGVARIDNVPEHFDVAVDFGEAGAAYAQIYRQCPGPQSVLLLVVKNPAVLGEGADWFWVKSGKFSKVE